MRFENERGRGTRSATSECGPPIPFVLSLRHTVCATFVWPSLFLSPSLSSSPSLSLCVHPSAPLAWAPRSSPSSNPPRHALACVNHAYRFSFVRVSEGRTVVAHVWPLLPFFSLPLHAVVPHPLSPWQRARGPRRTGEPPSENAYARLYLILFVQWPAFSLLILSPLPPRSLSLSLFRHPRPFLRVPFFVTSRERSPRRLLYPSPLFPVNLRSINPPSLSFFYPLRFYFAL